MLEKFKENLHSTGLVPLGARVLVGYSGGADSTCLLYILKACGIDVVAGHLHHGQRAEADEELELCAKFAEEHNIPFVSGKADVPMIARTSKIGLEEAGRRARYTFFENAKTQLGCQLVATGHTLDDHIETIIFNLTRGTGLTGLQGIKAKRDHIIRPLLPFKRSETRDFCQCKGFWFHDDPANENLSNSRTRIRLKVVPELIQINTGMYESVERLSQLVQEEEDLLNGIAARALEQSEITLNGQFRFLTLDCEVAFDKRLLTNSPKVVVIRGLRLAAKALGSSMNHAQSEKIFEGLANTNGSVTLDEGAIVIEWNDARIHVRRVQVESVSRYPVIVPGEIESIEFGWFLSADHAKAGDFKRPSHSLDVTVDRAQLNGNLYVQSAIVGDNIQPLGMKGNKLISDIFQELRLTEAARKRVPVVYDMVGPVWVPGACIAERVKITENTEYRLRLQLQPGT